MSTGNVGCCQQMHCEIWGHHDGKCENYSFMDMTPCSLVVDTSVPEEPTASIFRLVEIYYPEDGGSSVLLLYAYCSLLG
jgi:hypothetical protein